MMIKTTMFEIFRIFFITFFVNIIIKKVSFIGLLVTNRQEIIRFTSGTIIDTKTYIYLK